MPDVSLLHVLQPVWPRGLSAWRFEGLNNPFSERTSVLSESSCCGRPAHTSLARCSRPTWVGLGRRPHLMDGPPALVTSPLEVGRPTRGPYPPPCWESKGSGSLRSTPVCLIMVSAYTTREGGGW